MKKLGLAVMAICFLLSCAEKKEETTLSGLKKSDFASEVQGKKTALYVLKNKNGAEACITNFGGRLASVMVPNKNGKMTDVVLGYDNIKQYVETDGNYGAIIGRYGNRIANGQFVIDGVNYQLPQNDNTNCLHGGPDGYHTIVWNAEQPNEQTLILTYLSKDGEAGFPGNLDMQVSYTLTDDNAIDIKYYATTDQPTVVNLTNHSYFNLSGVPGSQILDHKISINADSITPVDDNLIPYGKLMAVDGTPMDLREPIVIGDSIDADFEQLNLGRGYDHNWVLNTGGDSKKLAAKVSCQVSGIALEVYTNEPGIQFYAGNFMDKEGDTGKGGVVYPWRGALCLETQHYPDSPNQIEFPSTVLMPGETYFSECVYKFTVE